MTLIKFGFQDLFVLPNIKPPKLGTVFQLTHQILFLLYFRTPTCRFSMSSYEHNHLQGFTLALCSRRTYGHLEKKNTEHCVVITIDSLPQNNTLYILFQVVLKLQLYRTFQNFGLECKRPESRDHVLLIILLLVPRIVLISKYLDKLKYSSYYRCSYFRQEYKG